MELLVIIITLALIFDYINGFHDAANSIAVSYTHLDVYKRQEQISCKLQSLGLF